MFLAFSSSLAALIATVSLTTPVITNCAGIKAAIRAGGHDRVPFDVTARALDCNDLQPFHFPVEDATGAIYLHSGTLSAPSNLTAGCLVRAKGVVFTWEDDIRVTDCTSCHVLAPGQTPEPHDISVRQAQSGAFDCRLVRITGTVQEILDDEIDTRYVFFTVQDKTGIIYAVSTDKDGIRALATGATVSITGICHLDPFSRRPYIGRRIDISRCGLAILASPGLDPFVLPVHYARDYNPADETSSAKWHMRGRVVVRWQGSSILIQDARGQFFIAELSVKDMPPIGATVDVVGFPRANPYQLFLTRASWMPAESPIAPPPMQTITTTTRDLTTDKRGKRQINATFFGKPVRLEGDVRGLPSSAEHGEKLFLDSDGILVQIDISEIPDILKSLAIGQRIAVTGVYILDIDPQTAPITSPRIRGFFIVPRTSDDIQILRQPPWWTVGRLLTVIGLLVVALSLTAVLTVLLHRTSERRGKELAKAAIEQAETELRIGERTRLAVELHDSISQNLTGISLELRSVIHALSQVPESVRHHVEVALKAINSTRDELRNCIWDLRNRALEDDDFESAIRQTVEPVSVGTVVKIRFPVPRSIFSDTTAHAILSIIRELVTNAIRHGEADTIAVAGARENGQLLFSVRDNGTGFDPDSCPGQEQGHFGLQGVRERAKSFGGTVSIVSRPEAGTKVTVSINLPSESQE